MTDTEERAARRRWTELVPLSELAKLRNPLNAKGHDVPGIRSSIDRHGLIDLLTIDERSGLLISGHGRLDSLQEGHAEGQAPPADVEVRADGEWLVPVSRGWASVDDVEAEAALIASNRLGEVGGWQTEPLAASLERIAASSAGLAGVGFTSDNLADLLGGIGASVMPLVSTPAPADRPARTWRPRRGPDEVPPPPAVPITSEGDVWLLGDHRVMCGNAGMRDQVVRLLGESLTVDAILTDPPYCSGGFQEAGRAQGSIGTVRASGLPTIANDRLSTRGYQALMRSVLGLAKTGIVYCFTDWRQWVNLFDIVESLGFGVRNMVVWDKGSPGMGMGWRTQHELVMFAASTPVRFDNHKAQGNVIAAKRSGNPDHPTQKPVELLARILEVTDMARTIYDPFGGSGSTLMACEQTGRAARIMELGPLYVDVVCRRWQEYTGRLPVLEATGEARSFIEHGDGQAPPAENPEEIVEPD